MNRSDPLASTAAPSDSSSGLLQMSATERLILNALWILLQGQIQHDPLDGGPQIVLDQIEAVLDSQTADEVDALR